MDLVLNAIEIRVIGSLLEKNYTTPDNYPLSLNSLKNACNQKSNRAPVLELDEKVVAQALETLRSKRLVIVSNASRVVKYSENFVAERNLVVQEAAVLTVLFLRGPQTVGELRGRSERIHQFDDISQVEDVLNDLEDMEYVIKLAKQAGRKEHRYAHLLAGEPEVVESDYQATESPAVLEVRAENERVAQLESKVAMLQDQVEALQNEFLRFKSEFE